MRKRVPRSGAHLTVNAIIEHRQDVQTALAQYFVATNPALPPRLIGATPHELAIERAYASDESDLQAILTMLAAVEAAFLLDYLTRCESKLKDQLSREMREIYKLAGSSPRFADGILETWKDQLPQFTTPISELKGAIKYRNWLAHGRYRMPKLGQTHDFVSIAILSAGIFNSFPLVGS